MWINFDVSNCVLNILIAICKSFCRIIIDLNCITVKHKISSFCVDKSNRQILMYRSILIQ